MIDVKYNNWNKWYERILADFGYDMAADEKSAILLDSLLHKKTTVDVHGSNKCVIFGAGPSLKRHISSIKRLSDRDKYIMIAADGATTALLEEGIIPDIIVTDLDGRMDDIIYSNKHNTTLYVHAHGDNMDKIRRYVPQLENVVGTTQTNPVGQLVNYGGFTDGDRAIHIAVYALNMNKIILAGMDFGEYTTRYSRPNNKNMIEKADEIKRLKLEYARLITDDLIKNNPQIEFEILE
ncbi:MAG: DUF115 domain-containing protein [Methanosphaera sp.]|nr:DUF115 domain-containing protein [Methanosphaera sp.]